MRIHSVHRLFDHRIARATKPFRSRGAKVTRCTYCQIAEQYCICDYQPTMDSELSVLLLMSQDEILKPSNTGRLIADVVGDSFAYEWHRTEPNPALLALISSGDYYPVLVFPESYVEQPDLLLTTSQIAQLGERVNSPNPTKRLLLIFLDGTWREARRMYRKSDYLQGLPVLSVTPSALSSYQIRKSDNRNHLSTAEVAALVFSQLGQERLAELQMGWFNLFTESYLLSVTRRKPDFSRPMLQAFMQRYGADSADGHRVICLNK